ncbi:inactive protein RESTRICTED TEV MOVEMENT [Salix suchowensis]|nr:inactive protein RESTRICTED TEV MOVEMENT [Salix suchowensis]
MENIGGTESSGDEWTDSRSHFEEEHVPSSEWSEDSYGHYLRVHLPDFKSEDVKLEVVSPEETAVSGERVVNDDSKCIYFHKKYKLPENSDPENITATFDDGILYVTVPKKDETTYKEPEYQENGTAATTVMKTTIKKQYWQWEDEATPLEKAFEMMKKNKGILLSAVLAFSLGTIMTRHRLESGGE